MLKGRTREATELETAESMTRGTSLVQVMAWAKQSGLNFQMAYREAGAVDCAGGHALEGGALRGGGEKSGDLYQVEDPPLARTSGSAGLPWTKKGAATSRYRRGLFPRAGEP